MNEVQKTGRLSWLSGPGLYSIVPIVLTAIAFYGIWNDSFTNWDDEAYVSENPFIFSLSWHTILRILSPTTFVCGNYQPITILSYGLNYAAGGLNPAGYILGDLLLHLLNVLLVFIIIRKISGKNFIASLCALLFGIHPMHVESVAWISGRKDLLYTFFYLASALWYLSYLEKRTGSAMLRYSVSCILFVCSLLSKSSAVTLPAVLFLIDYYRARKFSVNMIIDKIPFLMTATFLGLWAIKGQHESGSLGCQEVLSFYTRISIACHSFMFYIVKFFIPLKLSVYYPYPSSFPASLPLRYVLSPLFAVAAGIAAWYFRRSKAFIFGFGFFLVNVIFILHFIPVADTVTADRFSYCAYIGLCFIVAHYVERVIASPGFKNVRVAVSAAICIVALVFVYAVHERCAVWKNSETLWTDVIGKYPSGVAYNNRGHAYYLNHDYARALEEYNTGLLRYPSYEEIYSNRGVLHDALGDHARAMEDYNRAIAINPRFAKAYNDRGLSYCAHGDYVLAMNDLDRAIALDSGFADAWNNRGLDYYLNRNYDRAMNDFMRALALNPECPEAWFNKGRVYQARNDPDQALVCYTRAVAIDSSHAQAYNNRGVVFCLRGDLDHAIADFNRVIVLQPSSPDAYVNRGTAYGSKGGYQQAIRDFSRALSLVSAPANYPQVFFNRGRAYQALGDLPHAEEDFMKACAMHLDAACRELERK